MNWLEQLRAMTVVVADTGDIEAIRQYQPRDATTNPSLLLKAVQSPQYKDYLVDAVAFGSQKGGTVEEQTGWTLDRVAVNVGKEILGIIQGRVSTELDARLSFDTPACVGRAERIIQMYEELGVTRERILIKIASTWEGIQAARQLEEQGIHCNLTLLFSFPQAVACAEAKVTLISPFVGRIYDWYRQNRKVEQIAPTEDPGVQSVQRVYAYYKKFGIKTEVMGASFRHIGQIEHLAGCDLLTISPELLGELQQTNGPLERKLAPGMEFDTPGEPIALTEPAFRWQLNEDAMATEKLAEGIRKFAADAIALEKYLRESLK